MAPSPGFGEEDAEHAPVDAERRALSRGEVRVRLSAARRVDLVCVGRLLVEDVAHGELHPDVSQILICGPIFSVVPDRQIEGIKARYDIGQQWVLRRILRELWQTAGITRRVADLEAGRWKLLRRGIEVRDEVHESRDVPSRIANPA